MSEPTHLTDAQLVSAVQAGDRTSLAGIYDRYGNHIYSFCLARLHDPGSAGDATYRTFAAVPAGLGQLQSPDRLLPWLYVLADDEVARARPASAIEIAELDLGHVETDLLAAVWTAADRLDDRDRQLMWLHIVEGLAADDLAPLVGIEPSQIHTVLSRMKERVAAALGDPVLSRLGGDDWARALPGILLVRPPEALRLRVIASGEESAALVSTSGAPEWFKLGAFLVVTLVVGLLGFAVSAQFETIEVPPAVPVAAPSPGSTTTTIDGSSSSTTSEDTTLSTVDGVSPAVIDVAQTAIDFGEDGVAAQVDLTNSGGQADAWSISGSVEAIGFSATQGQIAPGETATVQVSLDRSLVIEGEMAETVTVTWSGGEIQVAVSAVHDDNPIIHNPQASPPEVRVGGGSCSPIRTTISARVRDTSQLASVVARWSPDGSESRETAMVDVGEDIFEGVVGPFTTAQAASVRIVATDELGNAGGASLTINVVPCP